MNKLIFLTLLAPTLCLAQVGIGTNSPVNTLQVVGNPTSVDAADGIIALLLTAEQLRSKNNKYTNSEKGTIVYVTDSPTVVVAETQKTGYVKNPGYYYFDGNQWRSMSYNSNINN